MLCHRCNVAAKTEQHEDYSKLNEGWQEQGPAPPGQEPPLGSSVVAPARITLIFLISVICDKVLIATACTQFLFSEQKLYKCFLLATVVQGRIASTMFTQEENHIS